AGLARSRRLLGLHAAFGPRRLPSRLRGGRGRASLELLGPVLGGLLQLVALSARVVLQLLALVLGVLHQLVGAGLRVSLQLLGLVLGGLRLLVDRPVPVLTGEDALGLFARLVDVALGRLGGTGLGRLTG